MGVAGLFFDGAPHGAVALGVDHVGGLAVWSEGDIDGKIAGGSEAAHRAPVQVHFADGVVAAIAQVEGASVQGERAGHAAENIEPAPANGQGTRDFRGGDIELRDAVACGVGDVGSVAIHDDVGGMVADSNGAHLSIGAIDQADGSGGGDAARIGDNHDVAAGRLIVIAVGL